VGNIPHSARIFASIDRWKRWARVDAWQWVGSVVAGRICFFTLAVGTPVSLLVQADVQLVGLKTAKLACK